MSEYITVSRRGRHEARMISDAQLLEYLQGTYQYIDSLRESILSLYKQNLQLLQMIANTEQRLDLQRRTPGGMDIEGLPLYLASFFVKAKEGP